MNKWYKHVSIAVILVGLLLMIVFQNRPNHNSTVVHSSSRATVETNSKATVQQITTKDVVGVWINHHNKDIHQKITFTKDHKWRENQHGVKNIYSGTWKIVGKRTIKLAPYGEKIVFNKSNHRQMNVVSYHHILNKEK